MRERLEELNSTKRDVSLKEVVPNIEAAAQQISTCQGAPSGRYMCPSFYTQGANGIVATRTLAVNSNRLTASLSLRWNLAWQSEGK